MKTGWLVLIFAALLGTAGFTASLVMNKAGGSCVSCVANARDAATSLAWMKNEFQLEDIEFQKVCALHEAYLPKCDAMCERIKEAGTRVSTAMMQEGPGMTPEVEAVLREYETLRTDCQRATLRHLAETAQLMKPEAGRAYMKKVLPHLLSTNQHVSEVTR